MIRTSLYHSMLAFVSLVAPKRAVFVHNNQFNVAFLEQRHATRKGISFHHKIAYSVAKNSHNKYFNLQLDFSFCVTLLLW